ncbi:c-type cytochrome [Arenibaculum sp.]|jgi:cytochrome c1|uniref:c-type cytochrome n=1 Tax=Arenibaculum sp. TaxID=2865862 RepID=UPI002E1073F5|nr:c-type cytochrome [Arenibaculum sp.]
MTGRARVLLAAALLAAGPGLAGAQDAPDEGRELLGDAETGQKALRQYACTTCHVVPGIVGASVHVGPPLEGMATRRYIAGVLPNRPENMIRWLMDPQEVDPLSAMPDLGVTPEHARDIAAYLYGLD